MRATVSRWRWWALVALVAVVLGTPSAEAQGLYYKEIRKDGRIYVFNNADEAGPVRGVRRDGPGHHAARRRPEGRDGRRRQRARAAAVLLQARHLRSRSRADAADPAHRVARRQDAHHDRPRLPRDLQPHPGRATRTSSRTTTVDAARHRRTPAISKGSFRIRRAKFKLEGWFWIPPERRARRRCTLPKLSYELQLNWAAVGANVGAQPANVGALPRGRQHRLGSARARASSASSSASSRCRSAASR